MEHRALLLLGCPEVPVQTSMALYTSHLLTGHGVHVIIAGNNSALGLILTADPDRHYIQETADLDETIGQLARKTLDVDICFVFIHNDAGISYLASASALISGKTIGIVFGHDARALAQQCSDLDLKHIWSRVVHNPRPIQLKIEAEVEQWVALMK